jgi:hypothetical protein
MRTNIPLVLMTLVLGSSMVQGCGDESAAPKGDLHVVYRIGSGSIDCEEAMINSLRVRLSDPKGAEVLNDTFPCNPDNQGVVLQGVDEGSYDVMVEGLSGASVVTYTGQAAEMVDVIGDRTNGPVTIVLNQVLPSLLLWIDFLEAGNCLKFGVEGIRVVLYRNGTSPIYDATFECALRLADSLLIDGLSDSAYYDLRVRGTNANDEATYEYDENGITITAGTPTERSVLLRPCSGLCASP